MFRGFWVMGLGSSVQKVIGLGSSVQRVLGYV